MRTLTYAEMDIMYGVSISPEPSGFILRNIGGPEDRAEEAKAERRRQAMVRYWRRLRAFIGARRWKRWTANPTQEPLWDYVYRRAKYLAVHRGIAPPTP